MIWRGGVCITVDISRFSHVLYAGHSNDRVRVAKGFGLIRFSPSEAVRWRVDVYFEFDYTACIPRLC